MYSFEQNSNHPKPRAPRSAIAGISIIVSLSLHTTSIRRLSYRFDMLGVSSKFSDMPGVVSDMPDAQCISSPYMAMDKLHSSLRCHLIL